MKGFTKGHIARTVTLGTLSQFLLVLWEILSVLGSRTPLSQLPTYPAHLRVCAHSPSQRVEYRACTSPGECSVSPATFVHCSRAFSQKLQDWKYYGLVFLEALARRWPPGAYQLDEVKLFFNPNNDCDLGTYCVCAGYFM